MKPDIDKVSLEEVVDAFVAAVWEGVFPTIESLESSVYELCNKAIDTGWRVYEGPQICDVCDKAIVVQSTANSAGSHDPGPHVLKSYGNLGPKRGLTLEEV